MAGSFLIDDLNTFLNTGDFAVSAVHTPKGGSIQPAVSVILTEELLEGDGFRGIVDQYEAEITGKSTDLSAVCLYDTITIAGVVYEVTNNAVEDGSGMSKVPLRRVIQTQI